MRARHDLLLVASLVLALTSCGKTQDTAEALCELLFECNCDQTRYVSVNECVTDLNAQFDAQFNAAMETAQANGLIFDQACANQGRKISSDLGCELEEVDIAETCEFCSPVHGIKLAGEACSEAGGFGDYSDCASGLICVENLCYDPCTTLEAGDNCDDGSFAECGEGLYCDYAESPTTCKPTVGAGGPCTSIGGCTMGLSCGADNTCQPIPKQGDPCVNFGGCGDGLVCADDMTCQPPPGKGQPCNFFCAEDYICEAGTCIAGPGDGQPCNDDGTCGPDTECNFDTNLCGPAQAAVCFLGESNGF